MQYDLGDCALWEYMFPTNEKPTLQLHDEIDPLDDEEVINGGGILLVVEPVTMVTFELYDSPFFDKSSVGLTIEKLPSERRFCFLFVMV